MSDRAFEYDSDQSEGWIADPFDAGGIDPPLGDVTDVPRSCVEISQEYVPLIIGALERLKSGDMYAGDDAAKVHVAEQIDHLQTLLLIGDCVGGNMDYDCVNLPLHSPIIDFYPQDPFTDPDGVPSGYACPPWNIVEVPDVPTGFRVGDVVINPLCALFGFPPIIPISGVPRFQIHVEGPADVDIEFVDVFQGGIAIILVDGTPVNWHDLQLFNVADILNVAAWSDLVGIAIDALTRPVEQDQISITTTGPHTIEVQFFPRIALDATLGWGGGIRGIQVCSAEEQIDLTQFVTDIRTNNGNLEVEIDGGWLDRGPVDLDDIQDGADLRGNGCNLEWFNVGTGLWETIAGTEYLNVLDTCVIEDQLHIRTNLLSQLQITNPDSGDRMDFLQLSEGSSILRGDTTLSFHTLHSDPRMDFTATNYFVARRAGLNLSNAFTNIATDIAEAVLALNARDASVTEFLRTMDPSNREMAVIGSNGWISAIQQLIVNDFTSTGTKRGQGRLLGQWADSTDATRKGRTIVQADDWNGVREGLRVEADGSVAKLGFYGSAAASKQTIIGVTARSALESLLLALHNLGLIDDQTAIVAGGEGTAVVTYYEIVEDYTIDRGIVLPQNFSAPNLWGDFVNQQGFVSEPDAAFPTTMRLRVNMAVQDFEEILRIRLTYIVSSGADGQFNHDMIHPSSGLIIALPNGQPVASGPETLVVDMFPVDFRWTSGQVIRFDYNAFNADPAEIVTLQKIEVMGVGYPLFRSYATSNDIDIFDGIAPSWST